MIDNDQSTIIEGYISPSPFTLPLQNQRFPLTGSVANRSLCFRLPSVSRSTIRFVKNTTETVNFTIAFVNEAVETFDFTFLFVK
jgi:hypothetical protein